MTSTANQCTPDQPDRISQESFKLPSPTKAAERVLAYVHASGDGLYDEQDGAPLYARDLSALACAVLHGYTSAGVGHCNHDPAGATRRGAPQGELERSTQLPDATDASQPEQAVRTGQVWSERRSKRRVRVESRAPEREQQWTGQVWCVANVTTGRRSYVAARTLLARYQMVSSPR